MLVFKSIKLKKGFYYILLILWLFAGMQVIEPIIERYSAIGYPQPVVRVIANSNLKEDLQFKNEVAQLLMESGPENVANEMVDQSVLVGYKRAVIPPKWENGRFYPQLQTDAMMVEIGQARGENWFCGFFYYACGYKTKQEWKKQKYSFSFRYKK